MTRSRISTRRTGLRDSLLGLFDEDEVFERRHYGYMGMSSMRCESVGDGSDEGGATARRHFPLASLSHGEQDMKVRGRTFVCI